MRKIFAILILLVPFDTFAGAWVNNPGESTLIHSFYYWHFNSFVNQNGVASDTPDFTKYEYKPYYEYGVVDGYSVGFSPSFQHTIEEVVSGGDDKNTGFVSADIFLKRRLYENKEWQFTTAIMPMIEVPGEYDEATTPFFGKKEGFWSLFLSAGKNTYNIENNYGYVNLEVGYRSRFTDAFNGDGGGAVKAELVASFPVTKNQSINVSLNQTKTVSGYTTGATSFLQKYGYDATQIGISDTYAFFDGALNMEIGYIYQIDARNTGVGEGVKVALSHRW